MNKYPKIALISPSKKVYSETFIQQHRKFLKGDVLFYFNGELPTENDLGKLIKTKFTRFIYTLKVKLKISKLSIKEQAFAKSLKENHIEIVVAEYGITAVAVLKVCKLLRIPILPIFHGYDASVKRILEKYKKKYVELFNYSQKIIVVSTTISETLQKLGCNSSKIIVTPCAPEDTFFSVNPTFKSQQFIAVGRFVDKKAPYYTILAFNDVLLNFPKAQLIMAGTGPLFFTCKNLVSFLKIEKNVKLLGIAKPEVITSYLKDSIAFVQHSIIADDGDSEGTPVAILEASAAGLPVISTIHAGIPDVIIHNKTGFLVEEHCVNEMSKKMKYLLENPLEAQKMGQLGKDYIKKNFSRKKHISMIDLAIKNSL